MSTKRVFVLDTNIFIEAARRYYAFDLAPGFWESLLTHGQKGNILSIDRVKQELDRGKDGDPLAMWADTHFRACFKKSDTQQVVSFYGQLMVWSQAHPQYTAAAKAEWAKGTNADAWVVAFAKANGHVVVTHESHDEKAKKRVTIPAACKHLSVESISTFEMLRELGIRLG